MPEYTSGKKKLFLWGAAFHSILFLSQFAVVPAYAAETDVNVIDVRTGLHPDKTRIVLEISKSAYYQITYQGEPKEIIIDLGETPGSENVAALAKNAEVIGVLDSIDVEDHEGSVRLRLKLRKAAAVDRVLSLKPDHGRQYRLVFDLKEISHAEWGRLVKISAPADIKADVKADVKLAVPETPEAPEVPESPTSKTVIQQEPEVPLKETPLLDQPEEKDVSSPESPVTLEEEKETYDERMTEESNFTFSGYIEAEGRLFTQSSPYPQPGDWGMSFALEPKLEYVSDTSNSQFIFRPFGRVDIHDRKRSHFDIRELKWTGTMDRWQVTVGINTLFWGVTESNHLVNILNQNDSLEDIDQEDKLGQPMIAISYDSDFGVFSGYLMTYFREQRFPGSRGRLRPPLPVDYSQTQYQAGTDKWHVDWAVRWSHVIDNFDVGLYHFRGTSREAVFLTGTDGGGNPVLIPRYNLIDQTGIDLQATFEDLLIKFEAIAWAGPGPNYWAMTGGFEYTFYGLFGNDSDISILSEYLYDERGDRATTPMEDDLFVGMRWAANDINSTELLLGTIFDLNSSAKFLNVEGSRRIGDHWKVTLDARFFLNVPVTDPTYPQSRDDFIQLRLARYF